MDGRRRITIVVLAVSRHGGGVAEAVRLLAHSLAADPSIDLEILSLQRDGYEADLAAFAGMRVRCFRFFGPSTYGFSPGLLRAVLTARAELMHVHAVWGFHVFAVHLWAMLTRRPYVVTPHGTLAPWVRARSPRLKAMVSALYQSRFLRRAAAIHVLNEAERQGLADLVGDVPVVTIPNQIAAVTPCNGLPAWWEPDYANRRVFLYLGRIHETKGVLELLAAWDALCSADPVFSRGAVLAICGWNDGIETFDGRIAEIAQRHGNLLSPGPQFGEAKQRALAAADFFVLSSQHDIQPVSILEAWSAGVPVLMTEACNYPIGFERGAAIRIGTTPEAMADGLRRAFALDDAAREAMSGAGRTLVAEQYTPGVVGPAMLRLYDTALARYRRSTGVSEHERAAP